MHMVGHQGEVLTVIAFRKKSIHAAVTALRDVMKNVWNNNSCYTCHATKVTLALTALSIIKYGVPGIAGPGRKHLSA